MKISLPQRISFHDSTINRVTEDGDHLVLELDNVILEDGLHPATLILGGVTSITCDGSTVDGLRPVYEDGEIWSVEYKDDHVQLIIDWTNFKTHQHQTHSYVVRCESLLAKIR